MLLAASEIRFPSLGDPPQKLQNLKSLLTYWLIKIVVKRIRRILRYPKFFLMLSTLEKKIVEVKGFDKKDSKLRNFVRISLSKQK